MSKFSNDSSESTHVREMEEKGIEDTAKISFYEKLIETLAEYKAIEKHNQYVRHRTYTGSSTKLKASLL